MKELKKIIKTLMSSSFLIGFASLFNPTILDLNPVRNYNLSDTENLSNDWNNVGRDILHSYKKCIDEQER